jgi:microcystin-dependent protein
MGLEAATYLSGLSVDNPTAVDEKSQGDDHLRLIKSVLKNTFPNHEKPTYQVRSAATVSSAGYTVSLPADFGKIIGVSCGTANRTVTLPTPTDELYDGSEVTFIKTDASKFYVQFSGSVAQDGSILLHQTYQKCTFRWDHTLSLWIPFLEEKVPRGHMMFGVVATVPGYVELRGGTLGETGSGGTYANDYYLGLYQTLWDTFSNTLLPVAGGRGASALADFQAGKLMTLFNFDGNAIAQISSSHAIGTETGAETFTLTDDNIPSLTSTGATTTSGTHSHTVTNGTDIVYDTGDPPTAIGQACYAEAGAGSNPDRLLTRDLSVPTGGSHSHNVSVTYTNASPDAVSCVQPTGYFRLFMKF